MFDVRPAAYVIGLLVLAFGGTMLLPMAVDIYDGNGQWQIFGISAALTALSGALVALACANSASGRSNIQQTFMLTTGVWVVLPIFGALPFWMGATDAKLVDGFFEAMSALTTTGSTVFSDLSDLPRGILLWRGLMQWFGGIGIIVVSMVFLPVLRVGGMQIFRTEGFDTSEKILPQAAAIARSISTIYVSLTLACAVGYSLVGLNLFDALVHAMTTIATGGFANYDSSFSGLGAGAEYIAVIFMLSAALPFTRYVQLLSGSTAPLLCDSQVRAFFSLVLVIILVLFFWQWAFMSGSIEQTFRKAAFNSVSIITGTGYTSDDYGAWGEFPVMLFFMIGLVGGCAGSTTCSIKIFRFQLLFVSISAQIRRLHSPNGVFTPKYNKRSVSDDVISSVMAFFALFLASLAILSVLLGMTGLDTITSISGAATALANVGPGLGSQIGPTGNFGGLNEPAKWLLAIGMLIGRLELMAVFVLFTANFWRN